MVGLLDIVPVTKPIPVNGTDVDVHGLSVKSLARILMNYPELKNVIAGKGITADAIAKIAPNAIAAIIAAGCIDSNAPQNIITIAEQKAGELELENQYELLAAIIAMTMPGGVGPFIARLQTVADKMGIFAESVNVTPVTKSQSPANT